MREKPGLFGYSSEAGDPRFRVAALACLVGLHTVFTGVVGVATAVDPVTWLFSLLLVPVGVVLVLVAVGLRLNLPFMWLLGGLTFSLACFCAVAILLGHAADVASTYDTRFPGGFINPLAIFCISLVGLADLVVSRDAFGAQRHEEREQAVEESRWRF